MSKKLLQHELSVVTASGAGTKSVSPVKPGYIEKIVLLVPTDLVVDVSIVVTQDNTSFTAESIFVKTGVTAGTYHLYPRAPTVKSDGTALTTLPYVKPVFNLGDSLTLTLANGTANDKRVTAKVFVIPAEPCC